MSQPIALYRKYRSRSFDELIGQQHVTQTLENAINSDHISHAYLFTGPHGVGKTSSARILAHRINDVDYKDEGTTYLDIIEIDAASNRRIEEIRNLRETIHVAPSELKYKVYIIDEVHMLTKEAFNALLKTLEEPPEHAVFILATTEAHKVPSTIISRTQRHNFKPIQINDAIRHLKTVAQKENIAIDDGSLELLAEYGKGSFRDTLSLLDQAATISGNKITQDTIISMLGLVESKALSSLSEALRARQLKEVFTILQNLYDTGVTAPSIAQQLTMLWRRQLREGKLDISIEDVRRMLNVITHSAPESELELTLAHIATHDDSARSSSSPSTSTPVQPQPRATTPKPHPSAETAPRKKEPQASPQKKTANYKTLPAVDETIIAQWPAVVEAARHKSHSLFSSLRQAEAVIQNNQLQVVFKFQLHCKKVQQPTVIADFEAALDEVYGAVPNYECVVADQQTLTPAKAPSKKTPPVPDESTTEATQKITELFGGDVIQLGSM